MGSIFLIVGAPAVGKSSTAKALASRFSKSVHISVDDLRDMVVSGLVYPGGDWSTELIEQLGLARKTAVQMAMEYGKANFDVVIDDFWDPVSRLAEYDQLRVMPGVCRILLYPSQEVAEGRNRKRSGSEQTNEYIASGIRLVYSSLGPEIERLRGEGWLIVDTTEASVEGTVDLVLGLAGRAS